MKLISYTDQSLSLSHCFLAVRPSAFFGFLEEVSLVGASLFFVAVAALFVFVAVAAFFVFVVVATKVVDLGTCVCFRLSAVSFLTMAKTSSLGLGQVSSQ
jgi:hypothetical protein